MRLLWTNPLWNNGYSTEKNPNDYCMPYFDVEGLSQYKYVLIYASNGYYSGPSGYAPFIFGEGVRNGVIVAPHSDTVFTRSINIYNDRIYVGSNGDGWSCVPTMVWGMN